MRLLLLTLALLVPATAHAQIKLDPDDHERVVNRSDVSGLAHGYFYSPHLKRRRVELARLLVEQVTGVQLALRSLTPIRHSPAWSSVIQPMGAPPRGI